jgi:hypothetical protein
MRSPQGGFDCKRCRNRGEENATCRLFSVIPRHHLCAGYLPEPTSKESLVPSPVTERLIRRRGSDLFYEHEEVAPDLTEGDWISALRQATLDEDARLSDLREDPADNLGKLRRFINDWSPEIEEQ